MQLLYATGLRVSELVSLPVAAARGDPRMILVRGKGGRERMVPLSPPARDGAGRLARASRRGERDAAAPAGRARRFLFPARGRRGHMTRERFFLLVKDLAARRRARRRPRSRRTRCATPSPRTCSPTAPTCG